jgi:hypothetical protein
LDSGETQGVRVGSEILKLARARGATTIFVVGIGRDVGKTTALRSIYEAACADGIRTGLASIGRDGEGSQTGAARPKPRLWLRPETTLVTAVGALPRTPAAEILDVSALTSPAGRLLYARVRSGGYYELVGPPTASGVREIVDRLHGFGDLVIVDGAVDRVAALAGGNGVVVVSCGAAAAGTIGEAAGEAAALVARLQVPRFDPTLPSIDLDGALTDARAAEFVAVDERRQIVVRDPTQIVIRGRAGSRALALLTVRCRRPLAVVAATVASVAAERWFEPREFAATVARATGLPTFDVYRGISAA